MAKKSFKEKGIDALLGKTNNEEKPLSKTAQKKLEVQKRKEERYEKTKAEIKTLQRINKKLAEEKEAKIEEAKKKAKVRVDELKEKKKVGRPKNPNKRVPTKSSQEGTKNNETRATFIVNEDLLEKLKNVAYWDRKKIKETVGEALSDFVAQWEEENGKVKSRNS